MAANTKTIIQNVIIGLIVALALFSSIIILSNSIVKISVIAIILITGIIWLATHGKIKKALKISLIIVMLFAISFASAEAYLFQNAGYPPTYSPSQPTLSMQTMLNASVTEIVQGIEQSPTFHLLKLEHKEITLESIGLNPIGVTGGIYVTYFIEDTHSIARFTSSGGHQYRLSISQLIGQPFSQKYPSTQTAQDTLMQIDTLGLNWFYNEALQIAQNRTSNLPTIDSLSISLTYESNSGYQGITIQLIGSHQTVLPNGSINGEGVLIADFQPDGTLIYMSRPTQQ